MATNMDHNYGQSPGTFEITGLAEPVDPNSTGTIDAEFVEVPRRDLSPKPHQTATPVLEPSAGASPAPQPAAAAGPGFGLWDFLNQPVAFGIPVWFVGLTVAALGLSYYLFFMRAPAKKPAVRRK